MRARTIESAITANPIFMGKQIETVEEAAEKIGQVTAEEVRAFVQKHFDLSQMSLSLVGDLKTLPREEMEELWMTYRTEKA